MFSVVLSSTVASPEYLFSLEDAESTVCYAPAFDYGQSHEIRCGIFHLWHQASAQKVSDCVAFWISDFWMRCSNSVLSTRERGDNAMYVQGMKLDKTRLQKVYLN